MKLTKSKIDPAMENPWYSGDGVPTGKTYIYTPDLGGFEDDQKVYMLAAMIVRIKDGTKEVPSRVLIFEIKR